MEFFVMLDWVRRYIIDKVPKARAVTASKVSDEDWKHHVAWISGEMARDEAWKLENELKRQKGGVGFFAMTELKPHGSS
jgi:hypothetical protein